MVLSDIFCDAISRELVLRLMSTHQITSSGSSYAHILLINHCCWDQLLLFAALSPSGTHCKCSTHAADGQDVETHLHVDADGAHHSATLSTSLDMLDKQHLNNTSCRLESASHHYMNTEACSSRTCAHSSQQVSQQGKWLHP